MKGSEVPSPFVLMLSKLKELAGSPDAPAVFAEHQRPIRVGRFGKFRLRFADHYAYQLHREQKFGRAIAWRMSLLEEWQRRRGDDDLNTLDAAHRLAASLSSMGLEREAAALESIVLDSRVRLLGKDHLETARASEQLGTIYWGLDDYEIAESLIRDAVQTKRKHSAPRLTRISSSILET